MLQWGDLLHVVVSVKKRFSKQIIKVNNFNTGSRFATNFCKIFSSAKILKSDDYLLNIAVLNHSRMTNSTRYWALKGVMIYWSILMKTSKPSNIKTPWDAQIKVLRWARE